MTETMPWWLMVFIFGVSVTLWVGVGGLRLVAQAMTFNPGSGGVGNPVQQLSSEDVAVIVPAHNEEASIGATLQSVLDLVPAGNVHVIADGCTDRTAQIARRYDVNVLELQPSRGKAGGIDAAVTEFGIPERFGLLLIVDADTRLDRHYLTRGLRLMEDPAMAALAGYAHADWQPAVVGSVGRFLLSYRSRLYAVMQGMKYGQTWRYTNVTPIVPGFASMYRTDLLSRMELNPPGLVIEDFNMTFELHHQRLGKVAFEPSVFGVCQDPENLPDYYRQICRWWLGFWQTIRRHGMWLSWFWAALFLFLIEVFLVSLVLLVVAAGLLILALDPLTGGLASEWGPYAAMNAALAPILTPLNLLVFLWLPDYLLTCIVAAWLRRPSLLVYGVGFLALRFIDATATVRTLVQLWLTKSTGRWTSPARRAVVTAAAAPAAPRPAGESVAHEIVDFRAETRDRPWPALNRRDAEPVVRDGLGVAAGLIALMALLVVATTATSLVAWAVVGIAGTGMILGLRALVRRRLR